MSGFSHPSRAQLQASIGTSNISVPLSAVNFNSANTDNAITIELSTGYTRWRPVSLFINGASASITTATAGLFTSTGGGGTAIVTGGSAITVSTASENTNNNLMAFSINSGVTLAYNLGTVYFRVGTAQGSAATANVTFVFQPLP